MEYDFAIIYFGLTRSVKKTHDTHKKHVFDILQGKNLTYKIFMHTWKTNDDTQNVWETIVPQKIDYSEYTLLSPDYYTLDNEDEFLESINMDMYVGYSEQGGWSPKMVSNHICMLESQKRGLRMVSSSILKGDKFKFIMFIRPDMSIQNDLPVDSILSNPDNIHIPNHNHWGGVNDQFAIMNYEYANLYGNRINELAEYIKNNGRTLGETYCKFIISKYTMNMNMLDFRYCFIRPWEI